MKNNLRYLIPITVFLLLWLQARSAIWNNHAQVDVYVMWERIDYWLSHAKTFAQLVGNELLPGTLAFAFTPLFFIPTNFVSYANYLPLMMMINMVILIAHWVMSEDKNILLISLAFFGPILLFRFDATVTMLVLLAFLAFQKRNYKLSGLWMGLATGMKVYPIIFLPYMAMIVASQKNWRAGAAFAVAFAEALLLPVVLFLFLGGSIGQIESALAFHNQKLISIESVPGSIITAMSMIVKGQPPAMIPGNGIWAVAGPAVLFNKLWMVPVFLLYLLMFVKKMHNDKFSFTFPYSLMLIFLIFSKNLNPQYMWWFMALLPFIKPSKTVIGVTLLAALTNQLVFPVFYSVFVENFFQQNKDYWIFLLLIVRNISLIYLATLSVRQLYLESTGRISK